MLPSNKIWIILLKVNKSLKESKSILGILGWVLTFLELPPPPPNLKLCGESQKFLNSSHSVFALHWVSGLVSRFGLALGPSLKSAAFATLHAVLNLQITAGLKNLPKFLKKKLSVVRH